MSLAVKDALLTSANLGKNERLVLVVIAAHANTDGDAWPSVATIAKYVGCSERTVQRALGKLVEMGRLVVRQVKRIATRVYRIVTQGVTETAAGVTDQRSGGDTQDVTQSSKDHLEEKRATRDWRRFLPRNKNTNPYPERRGAALPPPPSADQCSKHRGSPAHNCGPCRSESLGCVA